MQTIMPTSLTDKEREEFQALYQEEFNESFSQQEAEEMGLQLLQFMATIIEISGVSFPRKR